MVPITGTGNPCGKRSPGGTSKVCRAGRLPLGEREGVSVREAFPWGNKQGAPCGKSSPGGTSKVYRVGRLPLGEQARCTVREGSTWGNGGLCPCGKHSRGNKPRCTVCRGLMGCNVTSPVLTGLTLCKGSNGQSQRALSTRTFGRQSIGVASCYYVLYMHSRFLLYDFRGEHVLHITYWSPVSQNSAWTLSPARSTPLRRPPLPTASTNGLLKTSCIPICTTDWNLGTMSMITPFCRASM